MLGEQFSGYACCCFQTVERAAGQADSVQLALPVLQRFSIQCRMRPAANVHGSHGPMVEVEDRAACRAGRILGNADFQAAESRT